MDNIGLIGGIIAASVCLWLLVSAAFLLLGARIAGIVNRSYGRALGIALLSGIASFVLGYALSSIPILGAVMASIGGFLITALIMMPIFKTSLGKALGAAVIAWVFSHVIVAGVAMVAAIMAFTVSWEERPQMMESQAKSIFTQVTGISITNDNSIIGFKDSHQGFIGDGEFGIGVRISESTMQMLMSNSPPLNGEWAKGPVEGEIGFHCAFIYTDSPGYGGIDGEKKYIGGSAEARDILSSTNVLYCAKDRGPKSIPWHNGTLLVLSPSNSTLWISKWDW
jgi:hypothetical protein